MTEKQPVHTMSYGTTKISLWKNEADMGVFYSVGVHRVFTREGKWEKSSYFSEYDIPILSKAILDAHTWIQEQKKPDAIALPMLNNGGEESDSEN